MLRSIFLENLPLKALALALAVTLVLVKREDQTSVTKISVPVRVQYPDDRVLVSPVIDKVHVTVSGRYGHLKELRADRVPALDVNLSGFEGEQYAFESESFRLPPELRVVRVSPAAMVVTFEEKRRVIVPIKPQVVGDPDQFFRMTEIAVEPNTVMVEGAASAVEQLESVRSEAIKLDGRSRTTRMRVSLAAPPTHVAYLHGNQTYWATVVIEEKTGTRVIADRPIVVRNAPLGSPGYEASPATVDVALSGPVRMLDALDPSTLEPFVDVTGVRRGKKILKSQRVQIQAPNGLSNTELRPSKVTLLRREPPPPPDAAPVDMGVEDAGAPP
jgi:YbbR domain-containing protein